MAGVVPRNRSGRKQWTLHDGPRGSLRRLRNQLANDGCPESQVVLAKQLFDEDCELEIDKEENEKLAVYWLIKASEQGNCEATDMLSKCLVTGRGITEHNYLDVKSCINMTQDEKIARKAAREMFASLSNGEDFITSEQLQKRMLEIQSQFYNRKITSEHSNELENGVVNNINDLETREDWSGRNDSKNEKLTEDHLVTAAVNYSHGYLPIVNRVLSLSDPNLNALDHIPFMQRSVLHPFLLLRIIYFKFIKMLGSRTFSNYIPLNRTDVQLILLLIYSLFNTENIVLFVPTILFYGSFITMVILTFQMLQNNRDFNDFRIWSGLFLTYSSGNLNSQESEYLFIKNNLTCYGHFFLALLVNLISYPLIVEQWILQSEITIISFCLTFLSLLTFMSKSHNKYPDFWMLLSFSVNVIAKYPYEIDPVVTQSWRFLDLKIPTFASYIIVNGIEFCLNFRLMFYIIIPIIFVYISARDNWKGTYKYFIPHCVTLSWLQIVVINSQGATMFGLLRGTLALVGIILFLPLVGLTTILLPAFAMAKWLVTNNIVYCFAVFVLIACIGITISWLLSKTRFNRFVGLLQVLFGVSAIYFLFETHFDNKNIDIYKNEDVSISWEHYQNICHQINWDESNIAKTQINCYKLEHTCVHWNGYINDIKLKNIKNNYKYVIDKLPIFLHNYLYCYYGDLSDEICQQSNELLKENCKLINDFIKNNKCSLDKYNFYEYEISVKMQSGIWGKTAEIILIADHSFTNFTLQLKPNDKIYFQGHLVNNFELGSDGILGGLKPHITLKEIGCLACHNLNLSNFKIKENRTDLNMIFAMLYKGIKFVLNLLLNPIFVLK